MRTIWKIYKRDLKRLVANAQSCLVLIVLLFLPSFYAWFSTVAYMDPYSNTSNLPIAVANNDQTVHSPTLGTMNVGDMIQSELENNHQLKWTFTSSQQAIQGVQSGHYYAAIIIPSTFTQHLVELTHIGQNSLSERPTIEYYVNEEINPVTPKIMQVGVNTVQSDINSNITGTISKIIAERLQTSTQQALSAVHTSSSQALTDIANAQSTLTSAQNSLSSLTQNINHTKAQLTASQQSLHALQKNILQATNTLQSNNNLIEQAQTNIGNFQTKVSAALSQATHFATQAKQQFTTILGSTTQSSLHAQGQLSSLLGQAQEAENNALNLLNQLKTFQTTYPHLDNLTTPLITQFTTLTNQATHTLEATQTNLTNLSHLSATTLAASASVQSASASALQQAQNVVTQLVVGTLPLAENGLSSLAAANATVQGQLMSVDTQVSQVIALLSRLGSMLGSLQSTLSATNHQLSGLDDDLSHLATDIGSISSSEAVKQVSRMLDLNSTDIAGFMATPALLSDHVLFPIKTYGSAVSPLFTSLALWIGAFMLVVMYRIEVDDHQIGKIRVHEGYLGRLFLFTTVGILQSLVVTTGNLLIGVHIKVLWAFYLATFWEAIIFNSIIFMLATCFQLIGKGLIIILIMVQIPGAGGMYPIQMMPAFYRWIYPILPFTYGIGMMREAVGGMYGGIYWWDMLHLTIFGIIAYLIGLWVRPHLFDLHLMIDKKLTETDFFVTEEGNLPHRRVPLLSMIRALAEGPTYRDRILRRAARFEAHYKQFLTIGITLMYLLPLVPLILMFTTLDSRLFMLALWVIALCLSFSFVIIIEYLHQYMVHGLNITDMSDRELRTTLLKNKR